jgi:hypothetical protein
MRAFCESTGVSGEEVNQRCTIQRKADYLVIQNVVRVPAQTRRSDVDDRGLLCPVEIRNLRKEAVERSANGHRVAVERRADAVGTGAKLPSWAIRYVFHPDGH